MGIADFLNASDRSEFDTAVLRVRSQLRFHTHYHASRLLSEEFIIMEINGTSIRCCNPGPPEHAEARGRNSF